MKPVLVSEFERFDNSKAKNDKLREKIEKLGGSFYVAYGNPMDIIDRITMELPVKHLFANKDYESYGKQRDHSIKESLKK